MNSILVTEGIARQRGDQSEDQDYAPPVAKKYRKSVPVTVVTRKIPEYYRSKWEGPGKLLDVKNVGVSSPYTDKEGELTLRYLVWLQVSGHNIETACDQIHFYYPAECFHSFKALEAPHNLKIALCFCSGEVKYAYCGPSCATRKPGFCNHILALMLKVCKYSLYDCHNVQDLKNEDGKNPTAVCTSAFQNWHRSRLDGIHSQPVMEVVVCNPSTTDKSRKTGVTCLLNEERKGECDINEKVQNLFQSLEQDSSKLCILRLLILPA